MKGPIWKDDGLFRERQLSEQKSKQTEWRERFIAEFGQEAYHFLSGISESFEVIVEAETVEDDG